MAKKKVKRLITKEEMAYIYCGLLFNYNFDFATLNKKIIQQWSLRGLSDIKRMAWCIAEKLSVWEISLPLTKEL